MIYNTLLIYIFLSQFPSIVNIGSSYTGLQILVLPVFYLCITKLRLLINYLLPLIIFSYLIGVLRYSQINHVEIILRLTGLATVLSSIFLPIILYQKSANIELFKAKYLKLFLLSSIPSLVFCLFEVVYRVTSSGKLFWFMVSIKDSIFVPNRNTQTIGSISGLFPEHGLFAPFLLFLLGLSFYLLNFSKINLVFLISLSWIFISLFHSSGLFIASLVLTFLILFLLYFVSIIKNLKLSKKSLIYLILFSSIFISIFFVSQYTHTFLFNRFSDLFSEFDFNLISTIDSSLGYKLLPYYVLFNNSFIDFLTGSGSGFFSQLVISKLNSLPPILFENKYFLQNLSVQRFSLNSTLVCSLLEYGIILWIFIIFIIGKYIKLFNPINLLIDFSNILRYQLKLNELLSFIFFMSSFLSIFGPVPLTYPFPYLSLSIMIILFEAKKNNV